MQICSILFAFLFGMYIRFYTKFSMLETSEGKERSRKFQVIMSTVNNDSVFHAFITNFLVTNAPFLALRF